MILYLFAPSRQHLRVKCQRTGRNRYRYVYRVTVFSLRFLFVSLFAEVHKQECGYAFDDSGTIEEKPLLRATVQCELLSHKKPYLAAS
jgi:hypothetical protein